MRKRARNPHRVLISNIELAALAVTVALLIWGVS